MLQIFNAVAHKIIVVNILTYVGRNVTMWLSQ